ncbi:holo-[acyl-carrier-protein] synthase [Erysipelothrix sp. HDW6C]|uniref:holo-ACP synthase n=1 Tax=Erysipelothrix sp. HDW6C TaxID=2714930 RepID=UPI00140AF2F8|nr:holo-ACP synthase [Erysipelothrix sp. HDW6C]QIK69718.1 holo-[acyl-carrier-protein] synthase [Erysipelothrix sp. HDW6C]
MEPLNLQSEIKIGTDLVHMPRYEKFVEDARFIQKVLTPNEQYLFNALVHPRKKLEFLCGRYAAKEAYAKAKGTGIGVTSFLDIEVLKNESGCPISKQAQVSISHDGEYAIAMVLVYA